MAFLMTFGETSIPDLSVIFKAMAFFGPAWLVMGIVFSNMYGKYDPSDDDNVLPCVEGRLGSYDTDAWANAITIGAVVAYSCYKYVSFFYPLGVIYLLGPSIVSIIVSKQKLKHLSIFDVWHLLPLIALVNFWATVIVAGLWSAIIMLLDYYGGIQLRLHGIPQN